MKKTLYAVVFALIVLCLSGYAPVISQMQVLPDEQGRNLLLREEFADSRLENSAENEVKLAQAAPPGAATSAPVTGGPIKGLKVTIKEKVFPVYVNAASAANRFVPAGYMGDTGDIKSNDKHTKNCYSGNLCLQFTYDAKKSQGLGWAGVYFQNPANNWGTQKGGYDLTGAKKLTFWARGEKGGEKIKKFFVGGIRGKYPDSVTAETDVIELTAEWKRYTIDLSGHDMSYVNGAFGWATSADLNPDGCTFYLEDIKFEF